MSKIIKAFLKNIVFQWVSNLVYVDLDRIHFILLEFTQPYLFCNNYLHINMVITGKIYIKYNNT